MSPRQPREREEGPTLGVFLVGALVGAGIALALTSEAGTEGRHRLGRWLHDHHLTGHDALEKIRKILAHRHNGHQRIDGGSASTRRHRRSFG